MERLVANFSGNVRREVLQGREYLVPPLTLIVPGVLDGSKGRLFYPLEEVKRNPAVWNGIPIVVGHPNEDGRQRSAKAPGIIDAQGIGSVFNAKANGKLTAEGWFDVENTRRVDGRILDALRKNEPIELSTGLFTDNEPAGAGATFNGVPYDFIARNYQPDHLAILPDGVGACSIADGCGVLVNKSFVRLVGDTGKTSGHTHRADVDGEGFGWTDDEQGHAHRVKKFKVMVQWQESVGADSHVHTLDRDVLIDSGVRHNFHATKTVGGETLSAIAFAFVPDPNKPSTWKLRIDDATHVGGAIAAIGKGFRGQKVSLPASAVAGVKAKIRAAWLRFHPDKSSKDLPRVIRNEEDSMSDKLSENERESLVDHLVANCDCWEEADREVLNSFPDERLVMWKERGDKLAKRELIANEAAEKKTAEEAAAKAEAEKVANEKEAAAIKAREERTPQTAEEWLAAAPEEVRNTFRHAQALEAEEKRRLVGRLIANVKNEQAQAEQAERLAARSLDELRADVSLLPEPSPSAAVSNYTGAATPIGNTSGRKTPEPMPLPSSYED